MLLQDAAQTVSERLLATSEQTGRLLSTILDVDTNETVSATLNGSGNNIGRNSLQSHNIIKFVLLCKSGYRRILLCMIC